MPMHRNLGVFTARNMPFDKLFKQWQGRKEGFSKGRERSFHFGANEYHICGMISHLGPAAGHCRRRGAGAQAAQGRKRLAWPFPAMAAPAKATSTKR